MSDHLMFNFRMSGQDFAFDADPARMTGDEVVLIEDITGGTMGDWSNRLIELRPTGKDLLLIAFLARYRGNPVLQWAHFIKTVAPYTIEWRDAPPAAAKPATGRKAATNS